MNNQFHPLIEIASRDVACLAVDATLGDAASIMAQHRFSSIVVSNDARHPVGIVTERNILHAMRSGLPQDTPLHTCMSSPVVAVESDKNSLDAYQICMREGIRHLVLVDATGAVAGVVSETDFRMHLNLTALAGRRQVIAMAQQSVTSLPPHSSLMQALNLMQAQRESCVVVVENDKPVGIVTERDVVRFYAREPDRASVLLGEVMSTPVLSIAGEATVNEAAELMLQTRVRHLAVTDAGGRLIGLLSEHDLTRTMALGLLDERLEVDEMFLRTFIDNIPDLVWLKDPEGIYLACNPRFEELFGAKERDIIGKTDYDFVEREEADFFREHDRKAMAADKPSVNEEWLTFASNGYCGLFETIKTPMRDSQGRLVGVLGVARDITEREHIKRACVESEREFRTLAENLPDNLIRYDRDCRARYVNPAMSRNVAAHAQPVLGETPAESYPGVKEAEAYQQTLERTIATGEKSELELAVPHPDGELHIHHIVFVALRDLGGDIGGALAIGRDITERERTKRALASSVQEFRALAENLPDNIIRYDRECRVRYMNPAMTRTIAPEILPIVGKLPYESAPESEQVRGLQRMVEQVMDSGKRVEIEQEIPHPDGTLHWHHVIFVPERDEDGKVIGALGIGRDISERVRADAALKRSLAEYSDLVKSIPVGVYKYRMRADGGIVFDYVSPRWCELLDVTEAEVMRDQGVAIARIHLDELERFARLNDEARRNLRRFEWEGRVVRKNGEVRWLHIESQPTLLENGDILWEGIQYDVTDRRKVEEALRITASVFENSREAIIITDADNDIIDVNPAFSRITGYSRDEVMGRNPRLLSSGRQDKAFYEVLWEALKQDRAWRGEIWNRRKSGEIYAELLSVSAICDEAGRVQRYVGVFSDITYFKDHEAELSHVANYDALTGVPNRRLLSDRMGQAIVHAQRNGSMLAVCYIDLDGFKSVNDQYGHETGDLLLVAITRRLQEVLRAGDTLARLGGDEFVVLFNDLAQEIECLQVLERMVQTIAMPIQIDGHQLTVSASIGVTFYPSDEEDGDTLLRHADQAMYAAKQAGKNRYHLYDPVHDQRVRFMHESRKRILQGLSAGEFVLYYQPMLEFASGDVVGVEALIRWQHPERGLLLPGEFLPDIENSELEIRLGDWVMDTALAQLLGWRDSGIGLEVSINISAHHLQTPDFAKVLQDKLSRHQGLPRGSLQIEVLETAALEDIGQTAEVIEACRKLGVSFALDDFGTGYSSLAYLRRLAADTLKIDQSFVRGMLLDEGDRAIVQGVIALARSFGRKTVAEGLEDERLVRMLAEMGCSYGQGYSIAHPMPAADFVEWYRRRKTP